MQDERGGLRSSSPELPPSTVVRPPWRQAPSVLLTVLSHVGDARGGPVPTGPVRWSRVERPVRVAEWLMTDSSSPTAEPPGP